MSAPVYQSDSVAARVFALCVAAGMAVAALAGAALAWDGSAYLFHVLDTRTPYVPHGRVINVLLHAPALLAAQLTNDIATAQLVFGLTYALVPLIALGAAWLVVRQQAPHLFVWPALSIGLGLLPGLFFFVSEAMLAVQLAWPIWLAALLGLPRRSLPLVLLLAAAVLAAHPLAVALLGIAAVLAGMYGVRFTSERGRMWLWAGVFVLLALLGALRLWLSAGEYSADQLAPQVLVYALGSALAGLPLLALACGWAAGGLLAAARFARWAGWAGVVALVVAGGVLVMWARSAELWRNSLDFRYLAIFSALPFLALAVAEALWPPMPEQLAAAAPVRRAALQTAGVVLVLVLAVQSGVWYGLSTRLRDTLAQSQWACLSAGPLGWPARTPLGHWSVGSHGLLLQGRAPSTLMLVGDGCGEADFGGDLRLSDWMNRPWDRGWFDLRGLRGRLVGEIETPTGCSFQLTSGWHPTETDGPYWWRWSDGRAAQIQVLTEKDLSAALIGQIETLRAPNQVDVLVNGERQTTLDVAAVGLQTLDPVPLPLRRGKNTIELLSRNPPVEFDGRPLALSVANLTLAAGDAALVCERRS
jgi:hypothetical protein